VKVTALIAVSRSLPVNGFSNNIAGLGLAGDLASSEIAVVQPLCVRAVHGIGSYGSTGTHPK
jgi:hypothetical protein